MPDLKDFSLQDGDEMERQDRVPHAEEEASSSKEQSPPNGQNSPLQQTSSKNGVKSSNNEANSNKHRSPMPAGVPLPVAEHESLHTYVQRARNISVFSIVFTLTCAVVGLVFFWSTHSTALLGYSLEALVDVWSSVLVLWRFWKDPDGEGSYFLVTQRRESRASVGISFTFVIIGYITCWQAVEHLIEHKQPERSEILLAISGTSVIILSWSCAIKYSLSKCLRSTSLRKDAITSGATAIMAASMLVSTTIFANHSGAWWLDSAVAIAVSFVLSVLGIKTLITHPWWRKDFWEDVNIPEEEIRAGQIMRMPFKGSPAQGGAPGLQMQEMATEAVPVGGGTASRAQEYVAQTEVLEDPGLDGESGSRAPVRHG